MCADTRPGIDVAPGEPSPSRTPSAFIRLLGRVERVGVIHATANAGATLVFLGSWAARTRSRDDRGIWLARVGGVVLLVGAMCGGYMRSDRQAVLDTGRAAEPRPKRGEG